MREVAEITRGEINQTTFQKFVTTNPSHKPLLKGVEIRMFGFNTVLSQGRREHFNEKLYEQKHQPKKPPRKRIATQRITGVDEARRLVCVVSTNGAYFADSTNSIVLKDEAKLYFLVGLLNSNLLNWRFSLTSTNNNVGTNELEALPFPKGLDEALVQKITEIVHSIESCRFTRTAKFVQSDTFKELNSSVYALYGLSAEQIELVQRNTEGGTSLTVRLSRGDRRRRSAQWPRPASDRAGRPTV